MKRKLFGGHLIGAEQVYGQLRDFIHARIPPLDIPVSAQEWTEQARQLRRCFLDEVYLRNVPRQWLQPEREPVWGEVLYSADAYQIWGLRYEAIPGVWIPALYYEPFEKASRAPVVLNVNGHYRETGKATEEEQIRSINLARRGIPSLHPDFLCCHDLHHPDWAHNHIAMVDLCGVAGVALFFLAMRRGLDVLLDMPGVDLNRVAMTGLSGGGWQTIVLSALDERIRLVVPNAGYTGLHGRADIISDLGDMEQTPVDMALTGDYTHLTALLAPRPTLLIFNAQDECCFRPENAVPCVYEPIKPVFELYGAGDDFQWYRNTDPGTHNYGRDNREQFYRFLNRYFLPEAEWVDREIECQQEVLGIDQLRVPLPEGNGTFVSIAQGLAEDLPRSPSSDKGEALVICREKLRSVLRIPFYDGFATPVGPPIKGVHSREFHCGDDWSFGLRSYLSEQTPANGTVVLLADSWAADVGAEISRYREQGHRILVPELMFLHNSRSKDAIVLYCILLNGIGERSLGLAVAQVECLLRWVQAQWAGEPITLMGMGSVSGVLALLVGALNADLPGDIRLRDNLSSLRELIDRRISFNEVPGLYCAGLLKEFDLPGLEKMCGEGRVQG